MFKVFCGEVALGETDNEWLLNIIKTRRSIRSFREDYPVSDEEIRLILESAVWAPSARNLQPLEYVVVRDPDKRRRIAVYARQEQPAQAPVLIVVVGDLNRARSVGDLSPYDVATHWKGIKKFIYQDAAAAIQNMLLTAHSLGLGSLWIGSFDEDGLDEYLGLDDGFKSIAIVCVGRQEGERSRPPKRFLGNIVHNDEWVGKVRDRVL
jgi:nitroreductase